MKLTKAKIVREVYKRNDRITLSQTEIAVEALFRLCKEALVDGSDIMLTRLGKFQVEDKKAQKCHDLSTCEIRTIGLRRVVTFSAGKYLRARLNVEE